MWAKKTDRHIDKLFPVDSPLVLLKEAKEILRRLSSGFNTVVIDNVFDDANRLYNGNYPGYSACNTGYHDLNHAYDTFLAMARLAAMRYLKIPGFDPRQFFRRARCPKE